MNPIQQVIKVEDRKYYEKHLSIVGVLLPTNLTKTEISVLACFMSLDKKIIEEDMFNPVSRKEVMKRLNLSPGGLSNHIGSMIDKKVLEQSEITKRIKIKEFLLPENNHQGYQIKLVKDGI